MNVYERIFKLWTMISKMMLDGVRNPEKVAEALQAIVDGPVAELADHVVGRLKRLFVDRQTELHATEGKERIAESKDIFTAGIYYTAKRGPGKRTKKVGVIVYEMIKDGTFSQIFESFGQNLKSLAWTESQIVAICSHHRDLLREDGYATFFLFEGENGGFFVADVRVRDDRQLSVGINSLEFDYLWLAYHGHRVVVPQL